MATIIIRNLPYRITEDRLRELFGGEVLVKDIDIQDDPNPNTADRQAILTLEMSAYDAEQLAKRYQGMVIEGRDVRIAVAHFMD
ncbi:MAG: RNA-binding protein [Gammaproteobacteria bacterium]|nr:MAG: RNA-binding protein [Gammaproteobacteria bacterium]